MLCMAAWTTHLLSRGPARTRSRMSRSSSSETPRNTTRPSYRPSVPGRIDVRGRDYRAARRAKSKADFTSKIGTVSEEADESVFWLRRLLNANIESTTVPIRLILDEAEQLARMSGASHRTAQRRRRKRPEPPPDDQMTKR